MPRNEHLTRVELIDPALHDLGWTGELLREEKTPGGSDVIDGRPVKRNCLRTAETIELDTYQIGYLPRPSTQTRLLR